MLILRLLISTATVYYSFKYYHHKLSSNTVDFLPYQNAIALLSSALAEATDLDQHHFQPCYHCGFELALTKDVSYCKQSDTYKLLHPNVVYKDLVVFRDYAGHDLARMIMQQGMYDGMPRFNQNNDQKVSMFSNLPLSTTVLYPYAKNYLRTHTLGYAAGCIFQKYYHVPGQEELALKSNQSTHFNSYLVKMQKQGKSKECIDDAKYMKQTYRLWDRKECEDIFALMATPEYTTHLKRKGIQHIFKTNRHLGIGILLLDFTNERLIRKWYANGKECGRNGSQVIIQDYVTNPFLYQGHKLEFRSYFSIASTNPGIIYGYKVALMKQCALAFSLRDFTKQSHVCNTAVTKSHIEVSNDQDDDLYIDWNLEELQDILLQQGRITSKTWLKDFLLPQIYRKVTHLYLSVKDLLFQDSRVGEFFGVDFILDNDLRLWLFECNRNPNFLAVTQGRRDKFDNLINDMIEIEWRYVQSKYKRVKAFVMQHLHHFGSKIQDLKLKSRLKREFMELQKDVMDPEFEPHDSRLELVYTGNKKLGAAQSKYIDHTCFLD